MEYISDRAIFYYIFFASIIILLTMLRRLTKYKKLTTYQKSNRNNFVIKQGIILVVLVALSMGLNHILSIFFWQFHQDNIDKIESLFKFQVFTIIGLVFLVVNYFYNRKLELVDERVLKLKQDTHFNLSSIKRVVKRIKDYSHFYSGITYDYSSKDFTIQNVTINISKKDIDEFKKLQNKPVQITQFFSKLIEYINFKADIFEYQKISDEDLKKINTVKTLKLLILSKFEIFKKNQYFPSI